MPNVSLVAILELLSSCLLFVISDCRKLLVYDVSRIYLFVACFLSFDLKERARLEERIIKRTVEMS